MDIIRLSIGGHDYGRTWGIGFSLFGVGFALAIVRAWARQRGNPREGSLSVFAWRWRRDWYWRRTERFPFVAAS